MADFWTRQSADILTSILGKILIIKTTRTTIDNFISSRIANKGLFLKELDGTDKLGYLRLILYCGIKYFVLWFVLARTVVQMSAHCGVNFEVF